MLPAFALLLQIFATKTIWLKVVAAGLCLPVLLIGLFLWFCNGFTPYVVDSQARVGNHILERRRHWVFAQSPNNQLWEIIPVFPGVELYRELGFGQKVDYRVIDQNTIELDVEYLGGGGFKRTIKL